MEIRKNINTEIIKKTAENYFKNKEFHCSEAVLKTIIDAFNIDVHDQVISMASGFPNGIGGAGCTCGAVAGGVMAIGLVFGRHKPGDSRVKKAMKLSAELHNIFKEKHGSVCCRVLTSKRPSIFTARSARCAHFTGWIAEETAKIIIRESN